MLQGRARRQHFVWTSIAGVLLVGISLILLNVVSNWVFLRWDISRHQAYSLSPSSRKLVRSLEDPVIIKAYFTPDLPAPYNLYARYVKDILTEYRSASRGRVRYEFVPTQPAQDFEQHAMEAGLNPLQFEEMGSDQFQIRRGFMGLVLFYRDHTEVIPVIKDVESLEYNLTSRLARMTRKNKKVIAMISGHGETSWESSQPKLAQDLSQLYDIRTTKLTSSTTTPIDADAMIVVGPTQKYDDASLWAIDQAIMRGIPTAFLVDTRRFLISQFMVIPLVTGLEDLIKTYGINLTNQIVYDAQCETVGMTQNLGGFAMTTSVRYPYVLLVTHFEKDHPILRGIDTVGIPFCTRIESNKLPAGVQFTPLLQSTEQSWLANPQSYSVAPNAIPQPAPNDPHGPFILSGLLEGTFPSYFAGKPSPLKGQTPIPISPKTSIFVLATSHVLDSNLPEFAGDEALLTNAIAYLSHDDTLLGIRAKGDIMRPLKPTSTATRDIVKFGCILIVPMLPVLWGLLRWRRRQTWRKTIAAGFAIAPPVSLPQ